MLLPKSSRSLRKTCISILLSHFDHLFNPTIQSLALVNSVHKSVTSLADTWSTGAGTWVGVVAQSRAVGGSEERCDHSVDKTLDNVKAADELWGDHTGKVVGDGGEEVASSSCWRESTEISTEGNELKAKYGR